jgi:ribonuclease Z
VDVSLRELVVLGTSSQVPTRHRNHNGYLLRWDGEGFLFDPGEGTQRQFIYANVSVTSVTKIFITHFHGDHCLGLAGIIQRLSLDRVTHPVEVYFPETGRVFYDRLVNASIYSKAFRPIARPVPLTGGICGGDGNITIEAFPLRHAVDTLGYRISEKDVTRFLPEKLKEFKLSGRIVGELQRTGSVVFDGKTITREDVSWRRRGAVFSFIMDTRLTDNCFELARDADLVVCESTFTKDDEKIAHNYMHMTSQQAALVAQQADAKGLLLTHFSQRYADSRVFRREAREVFDSTMSARDLARYPFARPEDAIQEEAQRSVDDKVEENPDAAIKVRGAEDDS